MSPASELAGRSLSHYQVQRLLGAGGMGEVYRASDTRLGRAVALKLLPAAFAADADRLARFEREAKLLASLNHTGIAHLYGMERAALEDGTTAHFLVMELVEGEDLAARLGRGAIPLDEAIAIARQVAEALEHAHEQGVVHRDLKPANVKLTPDGRAKVLDFGLAKAFGGESGAAEPIDLSQSPTLAHTGTAAGIILGTAPYMSPEQARGRPVDKRTDIWSFGVLLWEMLSGRRLFVGETTSDVLASVLTREPDWSAVPPDARVQAVLRRCLERDPRRRLHDVADARILLEDAPAAAGVAGPAARDPQVARRIGLALALVALGVGAGTLGRTLVGGASTAPRRPLSLSVLLPETLWLVADRDGSVAISPDGGRIVVAAEGHEGARKLYLRDLGSTEWRPLPGTEAAAGPFFSPDGRSLGFSREGLHRLSLEGGQPVKVAPDAFGAGAWGPDGHIYFTPAYNSGLARVSDSGGAVAQLTRPDPQQGELNHSFPELLPGGRALVFTNHRATLADCRIEALVLGTGERHVVVENAIEARYVHPGRLAFVREEALMIAAFDPATQRLTGPAEPAGLQVAVSYGASHAEYALSRDGTLALVPREVMPSRSEVVRLDRAGRAETVLSADKTYSGPVLSPDGKQLALTRNEGGLEVLVHDLEHGATSRLVSTGRREFAPVWDRSGRRIFFVIDTPVFQIHEVAATGAAKPGVLLESATDHVPLDVSPDGRWLVYLHEMKRLGILPLDHPADERLLTGMDGQQNFARFSPDGRYLAYESNGSGRSEVYVRPIDDSARSVPVSRAGGQQPRWARSGEVFFWQGDRLLVAPVRTSPALQVGEPRTLFRTARGASQAFFDSDYDVSPDGQSIYLARVPDLLRPREVRVVLGFLSGTDAAAVR